MDENREDLLHEILTAQAVLIEELYKHIDQLEEKCSLMEQLRNEAQSDLRKLHQERSQS
jgi:hypothetical protein